MRPTKDDLSSFFSGLSKEEVIKKNELEDEKLEKDYLDFQKAYSRGICFMCGKSFKTFSSDSPCVHSLLRQNKFKKKDFPFIYNKFDYHQITSFLRWVANQEIFLSNINNLESEKHPSKKFEYTIKWKNLDWTFSCSSTDFIGHGNTNFPHYHFQMRIDKRPFIDFSDFHVPFSEHDLFVIDSIDAGHMQYGVNSAGAGIQDALNLFDKLGSENVLDVMNQAKNEEEAPFHMGTLIQGNISGDWLAEIIEEANKTGKSFASVIHSRKLADMSVQTFVEPSESLPEIASRKKGKNKTS